MGLDLAHGDPLVRVLDEDAGEEVAAVLGDVHVVGDLVLHRHDALRIACDAGDVSFHLHSRGRDRETKNKRE